MNQLSVTDYRGRIEVIDSLGFLMGWITPTKYGTFTAYSFSRGSYPSVFKTASEAIEYVNQ